MDEIPPEQLAILAEEDQGPKIVAIVAAFTALALSCVLLRFFTRIKYTKHVGWEDYCIAVSMCFSIITAVCQFEQVKWGNGKHAMFVPLPSVVNALRYMYFSILSYCLSLTLTKVSILLQFRRIFSVQDARLPIYIVMGICVAYGIESVFTGTFTCIPVDAFWDLMKKPTARCVNENALYYANASLNVATDLLIAALPVRAVWRLQLVQKQKIALIVILSLGWFVCIVSVLRLNALIIVSRNPQDATWYGSATAYWSAIEINLAIVCASTPALKPLIARVIPAFATRRGTDRSHGSSKSSGTLTKSKLHHSFLRLGGKKDISTSDVEQGTVDTELTPVTALPPVQSTMSQGNIHVTRVFDQQSHRRPSDSSSQRLVEQVQHGPFLQR